MKPLYAARIEDLGPSDFVRVECTACGHTELLAADMLRLSGGPLPPYIGILDLEPKLRCREVRCARQGGGVNRMGRRTFLDPGAILPWTWRTPTRTRSADTSWHRVTSMSMGTSNYERGPGCARTSQARGPRDQPLCAGTSACLRAFRPPPGIPPRDRSTHDRPPDQIFTPQLFITETICP
jgi:hypothetical protein